MPEHRHPICRGHHLMQLMGNEDDVFPRIRKSAQRHIKIRRFARRQYRGRLVEQKQIGASIKQLYDLDLLPLTDGQLPYQGMRIDMQTMFSSDRLDPIRCFSSMKTK
jgi:hypothetical protein